MQESRSSAVHYKICFLDYINTLSSLESSSESDSDESSSSPFASLFLGSAIFFCLASFASGLTPTSGLPI